MQPCPKAIANFSGTMHTCWDVLPVQSMAGHYSKLLSQRLCIWGAVGGDKVLGHRRPSMNVYELIAWYQHQDSAEDWPVRTCWGWALEFKNWTWEEIFTSPAIYSKISIVLPYIQKYSPAIYSKISIQSKQMFTEHLLWARDWANLWEIWGFWFNERLRRPCYVLHTVLFHIWYLSS